MISFRPLVQVTMMDEALVVSQLATLKEMTGVDHLVTLATEILGVSAELGSHYLVTGFNGEVYWTDDLDQVSDAMEDEGEVVTAHWRKQVWVGDVEVHTA